MQAKTKAEPYEYFEPVFDGNYEVPIDTEYNLPDYCPDIQKVLKCRAIPEISSYIVGESMITCEGICDIRVMYLDSKGECVRCCDFTKEFTASVSLKSSEEKAIAYIKASVEHMTCRAVSARRVDLHIAVCLSIYAVAQKRDMIATELDGAKIEKKTEKIVASTAVNAICHQFFIEDYIPLKNGKPPIETILRRDTSCRISEHRIMEDRLSVNGTADISFLYTSFVDGVTAERMNAAIDFSQIIDCSGLDDSCICDLRIIPGEMTIQPKEDNVGEYTGVNIYLKMFVIGFVYKEKEILLINDAYSVSAPINLSYSQNSFMRIHNVHSEILRKKCVITLSDDEIQKVLDIWCEQEDVSSYCDKGKINYRAKYNICLLYQNAQGKIMYSEKIFDSNFSNDLDNPEIKKSETKSSTSIWEYRITDKNTIEASVESAVTSLLFTKNTIKYLSGVSGDEHSKAYQKCSKLLVYYASQGESVWSIAKKHRALISDLRIQNDMDEDTIQKAGPIIICNR